MRTYEDLTDIQLQHLKWEAEETEDGKFLKAIKAEIARRLRNE